MTKRLIKQEHRESLKKLLPLLSNNSCGCPKEAHWEMLRTAMFSPYKDDATGAVRFGGEEIARAYGTFLDSNFKAGEKLRHFLSLLPANSAEQVLINGKEWCKAQYQQVDGCTEEFNPFTGELKLGKKYIKVGDGMQRRVLFTWSKEIQAVIDAELVDKTPSKEKVYISNGNKRNASQEKQLAAATIDECLSAVDILESPASMYMASYLNSLPTNSFTKLVDNSDEAFKAISNIESPIVRDQQSRILNAVLESPKPIYRPSKNGNTDRLFGCGANLTNLKKEVRLALTKDWVEFDLQSSQLAIVAKIWDIKPLHDFLSGEKSIWSEMFSYFGIDSASDEVKKAVKKALKERVYGVVYGESKDRIIDGKVVNGKVEDEGLTVELAKVGITEGGVKFVNHPLIKEVLKARQIYMRTILKAGQVEDAYGVTHEVNKDNILSIMSRVAQSYEQILIYGVFEMTNENNGEWSIQLLQHDGVSIKFHNTSRKDHWIKKICEYIDNVALGWDIPTKLIYEENKVEIEKEIIEVVEYKKEVNEFGEEFLVPPTSVLSKFDEDFRRYNSHLFGGVV